MDPRNSGKASSGLLVGGKYCAKCGAFKNYEEYHKDSRRPDGHKTRCKPCRVHDVYQAQMKKRMKNGHPNVRPCTSCGDLHIHPDLVIELCPKCRDE